MGPQSSFVMNIVVIDDKILRIVAHGGFRDGLFWCTFSLPPVRYTGRVEYVGDGMCWRPADTREVAKIPF